MKNKTLKLPEFIMWGFIALIFVGALGAWLSTINTDDDSSTEMRAVMDGDQKNKNGNIYEWHEWDGTSENMPSADIPIYIEEALGNTDYSYGHIKGVARNQTKSKLSYVRISFSLYNSSGAKIASCIDSITGLSVGEDWEFNASCSEWKEGGSYKIEEVTYW